MKFLVFTLTTLLAGVFAVSVPPRTGNTRFDKQLDHFMVRVDEKLFRPTFL